MAALFLLVGAALVGAGLVRRACGAWLDAAEQVLWGLVAGWSIVTVIAYVAASAIGHLSFGSTVAVTAVVWIAGVALWVPSLRKAQRPSLRLLRSLWQPHYAGLLILLALATVVFRLLIPTRMFEERVDGLYSGGDSFYDMPFHVALSNSFLHGQNFPSIYTSLPAETLLYPFMPDFLTAVVMSLGVGIWAALVMTAFPLALATTALFYSVAWRVARSQIAAFVSAVLFFFGGGLGFLYFYGDLQTSGESLSQFWSGLDRNYASMWDRNIHFGNVIADYLLPQRASLFGVPLVLMICACFVEAWKRWHENNPEAERWREWRVLLPAGALAGLLPYFHTHSYLAVGLLSIFLFALRPRRAWIAFWLPAVVLAAPRVITLVSHVTTADGFLRLSPGWKAGPDPTAWPVYWIANVGLPILLIVPAIIAAPRTWRTFYLAFVGLFFVALVVIVSPNDIDNLKLIYYWHAATCVLVGWWLSKLASVGWRMPIAILLVVLSMTSGVMALHHEGSNRLRLFTRDEMQAATFVREHTEPDALFLTAPVIHQSILCLAGRPVLRGDARWLWSHGYDIRPREHDVRMIYAGVADAVERAREYGVDYIYLGDWEKIELRIDEAALERFFPVVYRNSTVTIYDARPDGNARPRRAWQEKLAAPQAIGSKLDDDPAALFVEFDEIAFFVYRFYRLTFARYPRREELLNDVRLLTGDLRVHAEGWKVQLEENKKAFAVEWVKRPEFVAAQNEASSGIAVEPQLARDLVKARCDVLCEPNSSWESRASVLRKFIDDRRLWRDEYNTAFVLTHFFAYLKRNPSDPPDQNADGLYFWLDKLQRTGDYGSISRAFLESTEYKTKAYQ
jgi:hypothetical protein